MHVLYIGSVKHLDNTPMDAINSDFYSCKMTFFS